MLFLMPRTTTKKVTPKNILKERTRPWNATPTNVYLTQKKTKIGEEQVNKNQQKSHITNRKMADFNHTLSTNTLKIRRFKFQ